MRIWCSGFCHRNSALSPAVVPAAWFGAETVVRLLGTATVALAPPEVGERAPEASSSFLNGPRIGTVIAATCHEMRCIPIFGVKHTGKSDLAIVIGRAGTRGQLLYPPDRDDNLVGYPELVR
jgi:hypothetical protein